MPATCNLLYLLLFPLCSRTCWSRCLLPVTSCIWCSFPSVPGPVGPDACCLWPPVFVALSPLFQDLLVQMPAACNLLYLLLFPLCSRTCWSRCLLPVTSCICCSFPSVPGPVGPDACCLWPPVFVALSPLFQDLLVQMPAACDLLYLLLFPLCSRTCWSRCLLPVTFCICCSLPSIPGPVGPDACYLWPSVFVALSPPFQDLLVQMPATCDLLYLVLFPLQSRTCWSRCLLPVTSCICCSFPSVPGPVGPDACCLWPPEDGWPGVHCCGAVGWGQRLLSSHAAPAHTQRQGCLWGDFESKVVRVSHVALDGNSVQDQ